MPKPPGEKRVSFPFRGATDRAGYRDTPGDQSPVDYLLNVRPRESIGGRERGGQRPGLRPPIDAAGVYWPKVGEGPIQFIVPIARPAELTGFEIGDCESTHAAWESRDTSSAIDGNIYVFRDTDSRPTLSRHAMVGTGFANSRNATDIAWYGSGQKHVFGGINEVAAGGTPKHLIFRASYQAGADNDGFGSGTFWTAYTSPFAGNEPVERVATFGKGSSYKNLLFAAHSEVGAWGGTGTDSHGHIVCYDATGTAKLTVAAGDNPIRPFGDVEGGSESVDPGAVEINGLQTYENASNGFLYYAYRARPQNESMIGRFNVSNLAATGFDHDGAGAGAFQTNGIQFAQKFVNFPRGAIPTDISLDSSGNLYFTRHSTGWGPVGDPDRHPDDPKAVPVTVVKVNSEATAFFWESVTNVDPGESGAVRATKGNEELRWCEADDDGVYVGGREILGGNVFRLRGSDGAVLWKWRNCAEGDGDDTWNAQIDPQDGNIIVAGDRTNDWQGASDFGSPYANLWKLNKEDGSVLWWFDVGDAGVDALCVHINAATNLMVVGTVET